MLNGAKTYMKMHGDTVAGRNRADTKDVGGPRPTSPKRLSQELVVRDNVDILAGYVLTPNAMAAGASRRKRRIHGGDERPPPRW